MPVAQQLPREVRHIETQVAFVDVAGLEARIAHQFVDDGFALGGGEIVAFAQGDCILAGGKALGFLEERFQVLALQVRRGLLVIPGTGGIGR